MTLRFILRRKPVNFLGLIFIFVMSINNYSVAVADPIPTAEPTPNLLACHAQLGIRSITFSPDSKYVLASWSLGEARLWETETGHEIKTFYMNPKEDVTDVAFSPDGNTIATANAKEVMLWNTQSGEKLHTLIRELQKDTATLVIFTNDTDYVITSGYDGASLWDIRSGEKLRSFSGSQDRDIGQYTQLSSDNKYLITANSSQVLLWDINTGEELHSFNGALGGIFTPDSRGLITWGSNGIILWDNQTFQQVHNFGEFFRPILLKFSSDGNYLLTLVNTDRNQLGSSLILWNMKTKKEIRNLQSQGIFEFLPTTNNVLVPDYVFTEDSNSGVYSIRNIESDRIVKTIELNTTSPIHSQISQDGKLWLIGTAGGNVEVWDLENAQKLHSYC